MEIRSEIGEKTMKLQLAIDRVTIEKADKMIEKTLDYVDIIEIGTSLIKDYGLEGSIKYIKKKYPNGCFLVDLKTCDEGAYEFQRVYECGGDIPTVMGFSSIATLKACKEIADRYEKEYMIDLLEITDEKLEILKKEFAEAIFCIHLSSDDKGAGLETYIKEMKQKLNGIEKIAVAGGVHVDMIKQLKDADIYIAIVGSAILKAKDIRTETKLYYEKIKERKC